MELNACSSSEIQNCNGQEKPKNEREWDRISDLPDAILGLILSSIPTRESVGTSTLSKRWKYVWTSVPTIDINDLFLRYEIGEFLKIQNTSFYYSFEDWFMHFVDRVLLPSLGLCYEVSCVRKLRLRCRNYYNSSRIRKWIKVVTTLDDLEELDLNFSKCQCAKLPPSTFTFKKLMVLKLTSGIVLNFPPSVCLPRLKKLYLDSVITLDVDSVKKFVTGCPVLEELHILRCSGDKMEKKTLRIQSSSLKSLTFYSGDFNFSSRLLKLVIDATNLERLDLIVDGRKQVDVTSSMFSLVTAYLSVRHTCPKSVGRDVYKINVPELLMKMPNTKYLYLSQEAMESLEHRHLDYLPTLKNLMHSEVKLSCCSWPILPCLLESSPKLTHFVLFQSGLGDHCIRPHRKSHTPKCLMLYLEKIELHSIRGYKYEMDMVSYILMNAPILKKMSITAFDCLKPKEVSKLRSKVLKLPKASTDCKIYIKIDS